MTSVYGEELEMFRESVRAFFRRRLEPRLKEFETDGVSREIWREAGEAGLLGVCVPQDYGGAGDDGLAIVIASEEIGYSPAGPTVGAFIGTDICTLFLAANGTEEQKREWFPKILTGEAIQAMGMTEPASGSDAFKARTTAIRDGDDYVINGSKHYISNGYKANLIYVIARTDPGVQGSRGLSVIIVPGGTPGLEQRRMKTMGYIGGDTGELFFNDVRVPIANLVGEAGGAAKLFHSVMALDRLQVCSRALMEATLAFELTLEYVRTREIFGQRVVDFQNTQFKLAEAEANLDVGRAYLDSLIEKFRNKSFTDRDGSVCKIWFADMVRRSVDECLQLWGGAGYMDSSPISRLFTATRLHPIHVGPNEMHKSLMGRRYVKG
jgi:alkylation response protein AidB-like acyl-CoA dehydrogenase